MSRIFDRIVVCAYLAVAVLPAIAIYTRFDDKKIDGVMVKAKRPKLAPRAFLAERYQHDFTAWFESRIGFKGYSVRIDSTLLYHLFDETKYGATAVVGRDGVLYERDDIAYFSRSTPSLPSPATVDTFADKVSRIQAWFAARHRAFVPVIIPSKTTIYRDEVPGGWIRPVGTPRPTDEHVYHALKRAFDAHGVRYVDARDMLEHSSEPRARFWGMDARHWSSYAGCLAMREVVDRYAVMSGRAMAPYPCDVAMEVVSPDHVDHDLARLLNVWGVGEAAVVPVVASPVRASDASSAPSMLLTGCSFSWTLIKDAERSKAFGRLDLNYYNQTFVSWPKESYTPVEPASAYWNEAVLGKDLIVLDLTETYALADGTYSMVFVDQLAQAIGI